MVAWNKAWTSQATADILLYNQLSCVNRHAYFTLHMKAALGLEKIVWILK